ncbi:rhoptry protein ROP14, putative [Plasmodium gallinaceum]|uniref:Rhoptry protein ROP14, putative n=1 Tax=Plasmodium gallinaceum TaxID=5849 RepID=A0A1J1GMS8_PLAGA|nr:rhoptry protein ROP14, putative [Plasmodium gallinaceum]CRG93713.1 rhoptry protein ROP14, putative [Plasmodium gallinaceum]
MEQNETDEPTKILINDKEIDKDKRLNKIESYIKNFFNNLFSKSPLNDSFPYKNKALENTFWCSQTIYIRIILLSCFFSFVVSWNQNIALIGDDGLTPAKDYVNKILEDLKNENIWTKIQNFHSLFLFLPVCNFIINLLPVIGMILSLSGLFLNCINVIIILSIYILLQSIYSIGNVWFNYVYELELLELVFLCMFLVPLYKNHLKKKYSATFLIQYIARFFVFKVLIGSSLIRLKNSDLWGKLEGKYYIYETHPLPSTLSYFLHASPLLSKLDNLFSILTECVFSFFILFPIRSFRLIGGSIIFIYCLLNFFTGNSYLFYFLLLAPLMFCFDDNILLRFFFKWRRNEILNIVKEKLINQNKSKRYFKSFNIFYFSGMNIEELSKMYDTYFNSNKEKNTLVQEEELISRSGSNEICFYKNESIFKNIKNDLCNIFYWIYSKNGLQYFIRNKNLTFEIISHIICSLIIIIYICITTIYPMTTLYFIFYLLIFTLYAFYIFFYTDNIISKVISQISLLTSLLLIYSNQIFFYGFVNMFHVSLFFIHLICLFILSTFFLNNRRFIFKFTAQYFYFILFIYFLSFFIRNILSPYQVMNAEYGSFELMNVYGSFGKIKKARNEIIIQGTDDKNINENTLWKNYEFNCKPDNVYKSMCNQFRFIFHFIPIIYIDRLDWQLSALSDKDNETILEVQWFKKFLTKLSMNDKNIISLLYKNPFMEKEIKLPFYLRILNNVYKFSEKGEKQWWDVVSSKVIVEPYHIPLIVDNFTKKNNEMDHKNYMISNVFQQINRQSNHNLRKHMKKLQKKYEKEKKLKEKKIEEQRKIEERKKIEQKKKLEEQRKIEEEKKKLEQRKMEEQRKIEEEKKKLEQRKMEEQRKIEEQKRKLEQREMEEQKKIEEQRKKLEEQKKIEEYNISKKKKFLEKQRKFLEEKELEEQERNDKERKKFEKQRKIEEQKIFEEQRKIEEEKKKLREQKKIDEERRKLEEQKQIKERKRIEEEKQKLEEMKKNIEEKKKLEQKSEQQKNYNKSDEELDERLKNELLSENNINVSTIHKLNNSNNLQHIKIHDENLSDNTKRELNKLIDEKLDNELNEKLKEGEPSKELKKINNYTKNDNGEIIESEEEVNEEIDEEKIKESDNEIEEKKKENLNEEIEDDEKLENESNEDIEEEMQKESSGEIEEKKKEKSNEEVEDDEKLENESNEDIEEEKQNESSGEIEEKKKEKSNEEIEDEKLENELNQEIEEKENENEEFIKDEIKQKEELEKELYEDIEEKEKEKNEITTKEKKDKLSNEKSKQKLENETNINEENINKNEKNNFNELKDINMKKDEELKKRKSNVASYEFKKFMLDKNMKNKLDNAIKNSYTKYKLLSNYSDKINKLGLFNLYNDQNKSIAVNKLKERSNYKGDDDVYLKDAIYDNDNDKKNTSQK